MKLDNVSLILRYCINCLRDKHFDTIGRSLYICRFDRIATIDDSLWSVVSYDIAL